MLAILLIPALLVRAVDNGFRSPNGGAIGFVNPTTNVNPGKIRGRKTGGYSLTLVGNYTGAGTGAVTDTTVSLAADIKMPDGATATLVFNNMPRVNDRFQGTATYHGIGFTLSGRVDLPSAKDADQTAAQAATGRVTAILGDSTGNGARVVAIQDEASRGGTPAAPGNG